MDNVGFICKVGVVWNGNKGSMVIEEVNENIFCWDGEYFFFGWKMR